MASAAAPRQIENLPTPVESGSYGKTWLLLCPDDNDLDRFLEEHSCEQIAQAILKAIINIIAVGSERVRVGDIEHMLFFVQSRLSSSYNHCTVVAKLTAIGLAPGHYKLGRLSTKQMNPKFLQQSYGRERVERRVQGGSRPELPEDELLAINDTTLKHTQAKKAVTVLKRRLAEETERSSKSAKRSSDTIAELQETIKSGVGGRVVAEVFYNLLKKRDKK
jgi:hypothetical protein